MFGISSNRSGWRNARRASRTGGRKRGREAARSHCAALTVIRARLVLNGALILRDALAVLVEEAAFTLSVHSHFESLSLALCPVLFDNVVAGVGVCAVRADQQVAASIDPVPFGAQAASSEVAADVVPHLKDRRRFHTVTGQLRGRVRCATRRSSRRSPMRGTGFRESRPSGGTLSQRAIQS